MKRIEYRTADKSTWGDGPWQNEPDKIQFEDPTTSLPCLIKRNGMGALCGYVGVAPTHPAYKQHYDNVLLGDATPHGGLTYSDHCQPEGDEAESICHLPEPGEPDHVWWLGFDCAHAYDYYPAYASLLPRDPNDVYRDIPYVEQQIAAMASALAAGAYSIEENR